MLLVIMGFKQVCVQQVSLSLFQVRVTGQIARIGILSCDLRSWNLQRMRS